MMNQFFDNPWIVAALALWVLPWKGYSLWLSARKGEKWWFVALLIINTLAVLEILYIFVFSKMAQKNNSASLETKNIEKNQKAAL